MRPARKAFLIICLIAILIFGSGWFVFSTYIRPHHYQLLRPYTQRSGKELVTTRFREGNDGDVEIYIPAGKAIVGKENKEIELGAYWIDQIPVRVKDFKRYTAEARRLPAKYRGEYADDDDGWFNELKPVTFVGWDQAEAYCEYYGGHLPTEAQWEKAGRGEDGALLTWPDDQKAFDHANYDNFYGGLTPAGWLPKGKTVYGLLDMSGNVREWVIDGLLAENQEVQTQDWQTIRDSAGRKTLRILKGGSSSDDLSHLRFNFRDAHDPKSPGINRGFRCVYEAEESD